MCNGGTYIRDLDLNNVRQMRDNLFRNNHLRTVINRRMDIIATVIFASRNGEEQTVRSDLPMMQGDVRNVGIGVGTTPLFYLRCAQQRF